MENEIVLKEANGEILASSRDVAERFGKAHASVLKSIEGEIRNDIHITGLIDEILASGNPPTKYFIKTTYENRGKQYKEYDLTRDGFSLLVMGFTGSEALKWKLKYIEAFNKMEEAIRHSLSSKDIAILAIVNADSDLSRATAITNYENLVTKPLIEALEEQKPLVDFANKVTNTNNAIDVGEMAKLLYEENNIKIGRNRLFEILRSKKILMSNNTPYQSYMDKKWFKLIETVKENSYGSQVFTKVLITGVGQLKITDIILSEYKNELSLM